MAHRIGFQCFDTEAAATDYQMSLVVPVVTADGSLVHPVKQGETWTHQGQPVKLSFGTCDPAQDFKDGLQVASVFIGLIVTAWCFRYLYRFIDQLGRQGESEE